MTERTITPEHDYRELDLSEWTLTDLIKAEAEARRNHDLLKAEASKWGALYDYLSIHVIPSRMDDDDVDGIKVSGIGRVNLRPDMWVKTLDPDRLQMLLRENGLEDIIVPSVNGSTLKALIKEQMKKPDGVEFPDDVVKITPYTRAVITKS